MTTFKEHHAHTTGKLSLAQILEIFAAGGQLPLKFTAYDGSSAGPDDAELGLDLLTPRGTTYLATAPGDLGLARAYVSGDLEAHGVHPGDPYKLLNALTDKLDFKRPPARVLASIIRSIGVEHLVPIPPPPQEALPRWRRIAEGLRHSRPATPRPSTTTTTCPTRSTSGCWGRR
ncbi:putative fatty acid methyltransferase [Mycobacterium talmoniae]|uniref:Putative fatty acid methyltransferase n=1 Tax=Mycobacterium talmoniae TaxID=1858794 RepID=A0A2S8BS87_9MYCO|nr:putative fatty acid methyltransferase [Mycobacterium talmoniae]